MSTLRHRLLLGVGLASILAPIVRSDELDPTPFVESSDNPTIDPAETMLQPLQHLVLATHPILRYRFSEARGVLSAPGQEQTSTIQSVSLALRWNVGDYVSLRYTPLWTFYSNPRFDDNLGHEVVLSYDRSFVDWNVRTAFHYTKVSVPLVETGQQTSQDTASLILRAERPLGSRTAIELGLRADRRAASSFSNFNNWSTEDWLHFQVSERLLTSIGLAYGFVAVSQSSDMYYEQLRARLRWVFTDKIHADMHVGYENRHFVNSAASDARTPVFGATVYYKPVATTTATLTTERLVTPSYFRGQVDRITSWQLGLNQRLLERFYLDLALGHRDAHHRSSAIDTAEQRVDRGEMWRVRLSTNARKNISVAVFYQDKKNHSSDLSYDFDGTQFGFECLVRF